MEQGIRGIECAFGYYKLNSFLKYLSRKKWNFYIPWCLKNGTHPVKGLTNANQNLSQLFNCRIWELELQCYKHTGTYEKIVTYQDFMRSSCLCFLLYYDCENLEIYIKETEDFKHIWEYLHSHGAEHLIIKTSKNDKRIQLSL